MRRVKTAEGLLMSLINSVYKGKITKSNYIDVMNFVALDDELQLKINNGCGREIANHKLNLNSDLLDEIEGAECMGGVSKILRQYGR